LPDNFELTPHDRERQREFVSEVFHTLSQPLSALHCSLDLSLRRDQTAADLRNSLEAGLRSAERLRERLLLLRALDDALDPGDVSRSIDLGDLLRDLHEDLLPLFESTGRTFHLDLSAGSLQVRADKIKLRASLFCFLEYLFRHCSEGEALRIEVNSEAKTASVRISAATCLPVGPDGNGVTLPHACEVELASRTLRAAGGTFRLVSSVPGASVWLATLPIA
jgi:signal transduction histidine kinase